MKEKIVLREWLRLLGSEEFKDQLESYKLITDSAMDIIFKEDAMIKEMEIKRSALDRDANCLFQMTTLKCLSIGRLIEEKIEYRNPLNNFQMKVYDPFAIHPIIRSQFEAYGHFNNLYLKSNSEEEKKLKYEIWVMIGLLNRQKFHAKQHEHIIKKNNEKQEIKNLTHSIRNNTCFTSLDTSSQQEIFKKIDMWDWKLVITKNKATYVGWQELVNNSGVNENLKQMYRRFSLHSHPSNVSVFQFRDAYVKGKENADGYTTLLLDISKYFISLFISDYCKHSEAAKIAFQQLPVLNQLLINTHNQMFRGEEFQINNIWVNYNDTLTDMAKKGELSDVLSKFA